MFIVVGCLVTVECIDSRKKVEEERGGCNTRTGWTLDSALVVGMDWLCRQVQGLKILGWGHLVMGSLSNVVGISCLAISK